jgi:hypothetical protein
MQDNQEYIIELTAKPGKSSKYFSGVKERDNAI